MSTEKKKWKDTDQSVFWQGPVLLAIPFAAAMLFAAIRWGGLMKNLIHVVIKMAVIS